MLTLRTYAHVIREEETDLSFADFEESDGSERLYPAPAPAPSDPNENAPDLTGRGRWENLEHETRFELATPTLATSSVWIPKRSSSVQSRSMAGTCAHFVIPGQSDRDQR